MSIHTFLFLVKFNLFTGACSVVFFAPVLIGACWWHLALVCWAWLSRHNLTFQSKTNPRAREWAGAGKKENAIFCTFWGNWRNGSNESTASYLRFTVQILGKTKTQKDRLSLTLNSPLSGNRIIGNSEVCKITFSLRRAKWLSMRAFLILSLSEQYFAPDLDGDLGFGCHWVGSDVVGPGPWNPPGKLLSCRLILLRAKFANRGN